MLLKKSIKLNLNHLLCYFFISIVLQGHPHMSLSNNIDVNKVEKKRKIYINFSSFNMILYLVRRCFETSCHAHAYLRNS
jgi:hypothetical protein